MVHCFIPPLRAGYVIKGGIVWINVLNIGLLGKKKTDLFGLFSLRKYF